MNGKKLAQLLLIIFLLEFVVIVFINIVFYKNIISLFIILLTFSVIQMILFYAIKRLNKRRDIVINIFLLLAFPFIFHLLLPSYTYGNGQDLVEETVQSENVTFSRVSSKTVPTTAEISWLYRNRHYYYEVEHSNEKTAYAVDPFNGVVIELEEPFYQDRN